VDKFSNNRVGGYFATQKICFFYCYDFLGINFIIFVVSVSVSFFGEGGDFIGFGGVANVTETAKVASNPLGLTRVSRL